MANLEEGELEDGELLSSDEESEGEAHHEDPPSKETTNKPPVTSETNIPKLLELDVNKSEISNTNHSSATHSPEERTANVNLNETKAGSEDGEIFSDDEEAAYYPQHVRSRPRPGDRKTLNETTKQSDAESQKSDTESLSGIRSGRRSRDRNERGRNRRSSPESESDSTYQNRTPTKEQGLFYEDRDGSETESTGSRERTRSRSRERERDRHSSPKYGGSRNRNRERDRGNRSRNDDDSSDDREQAYRGSSSYYGGRQSGGYGRTRGGYGGYQQRGGYGSSKFQVGGASAGGGGGYTSSVQPGLMNTGMTAQQFHTLASKVKKRREDGLPLLPQPNLDKCGNLDQYNYPAPPSWYLEELDAWEKREKEREKEEEKVKQEGTALENVEQAKRHAEESKAEEIVIEQRRPISPLFRRTSSVALEIVSSPISDEEPSLEVMEDEPEADKDTEPSSAEVVNEAQLEVKVEPMETVPSAASDAPAVSNDAVSTTGVKPLKELAANAVQANTKPASPTTTTIATTAIATSTIAISVTTTTATDATMSTASATTPTSTTESAPQSMIDLSTSTAMPPQPEPTSNSAHLPVEAPPTKPTPAPLTIITEPIESDSDNSHSPSLSPTIPIQSGVPMKGAPSLHPKGVFRPKLMSESDSEGDYDDYLDQLDEEEDDVTTKNSTSLLGSTLSEGFPLIGGSSTPSLTSLFEAGNKAGEATNQILGSVGDPFSEDFPTIGKDAAKSSSNQVSLMSLIGQEKGTDEKKVPGEKKGKISRRKVKDSAWWTKQKDKEKNKQVTSEETKKPQLCKYYLNGNCKNGGSCAYSHDCKVQKKKEMCKYYIQGYCSKGELCHYYHETFPCKYIHTKGYCKNGDQCRFSHAPLTPDTKELLITVLDPAQVAALNANISARSSLSLSSLSHSPEPTSVVGSLVVSIPKDIVNGLVVSIPLSKLQKGIKHPPTTPSPAIPAPAGNAFPPTVPPQQQYQNQPPPRGPFPFQQHSGNPVPFLPGGGGGGGGGGGPGQYGVPPPPPPPTNMHPQPIPLFPPKQFQAPPTFPPNQAPPPSGPRMTLPPPPPPSGVPGQRRSLLPTPPPHMMISQEELKRMETSKQHEYWEAPELGQQNQPYHYNQHPPPQAPPMGGAPPYNNGPPNQFGRGGGFPQQGPPRGPFPPQQPYGQPPLAPTQQFRAPPPSQQQAPPPFHPPGPIPHPPHPQWVEQQGMRPQSGMEQRHPPPGPGMDPRHNQASGPPFPSRVDPRHQLQGGPMNPPQGGMGNDPRRPANIPPDQMASPPQQQEGGWNAPPPGLPPGLPVDVSPSYQRAPPPSHQQQHGFLAQQPSSGVPPASGLAPFQPPQPPYQSHNAMSPPRYSMPPQQQQTQVGGAAQAHALPPGMDKASPPWGTSPEYSGNRSPSGGSVSSGDHTKRRDPRMKYAHLKIKSKGQNSNAMGQSNSQPILKRSAGEAGMDLPGSGFKIPKLLQDSSSLNRPLDPGELFSGKDALSVGDEREHGGGITAPYGAFRSMFAQAPSSESEVGNNAESAGSSQKFGEITMGAEPSTAKAKESNDVDIEKRDTSDSTKVNEAKDSNSVSKPSEVPSYLAHLNMGLEDDLKIDSAFGSLSEKSSSMKDSESSKKNNQESQARKLPSIFGFS